MVRKKTILIGLLILSLVLCISLLLYFEIFWLTVYYIISGMLFVGNFIFEIITNPFVYPVLYWITYISALAAIITLIGTLLWYFRARKKFSSPMKRSKITSVGITTLAIIAVGIIQVVLSIFNRDLLYVISFYLFIGSLIFLGIRTFVNVSSSLAYRSRVKPAEEGARVSIIVPAYNEEKVIEKTINSLINLTYDSKEVIIVDDGSKDDTLKIVQRIAGQSPIRVFSKPNGGKWSALNEGIKHSKGEIIVCIDADTILDKGAIQRLLPHFDDPKIGAIAGNVKVGNRKKILTKLQALEYVSSINIQRRSESFFKKITVVPGPLGAFRKSVIEEVGMYDGNTYAEDAELTLRILKAGYEIKYEPRAIGYTEAPETVTDLAKQRYRWYRGLLQAMTKHKDMLFNSKYGSTGWFMIPWIFFNGVIFPWYTFFTLIWLLTLMFNPFSGFVIYRPNPRGPPEEPPGQGDGGPGNGGGGPGNGGGGPGNGGGGPGNGGGGPGESVNPSQAGPPGQELVITINFFQAIPVIYIFWFFVFILLEIAVALYAISTDVKEKPRLVLYVVFYKLFYGYLIHTIRLLSQ
ncbi:MAG: glycosyltransferase, partial [Promethearchaeota archaeon]